MKLLGVLSIFMVFGWAIVEAAYMGWPALTVAAIGLLLSIVFVGCQEKSWGDTFAWIFFGVCVVLIGISFRTSFAESTTRAAIKVAFLLLLVLLAWRGSRAASQPAH